MAQGIRVRNQQTITGVDNTKVTGQSLGLGMNYRELYITISGAPTLTALNNTQANGQPGLEFGYLKQIDVVANGSEVIRTMTGNQLWWLNRFLYQCVPPITPTFGDTTTANPAFNTTLVMPFWMPQAYYPVDTMLRSATLSGLRVDCTFGTYTDINSAATAWTTAPTITIDSYECFPQSKNDPNGPFTGSRIYKDQVSISGATANFVYPLAVNGGAYRGILINTEAAAGGSDLATCLNRIKIFSGTTIYRDLSAQYLRQVTQIRTQLPRPVTMSASGAAGAYTLLQGTTKTDPNAWYWLDFAQGGPNAYLTEIIDTLGLSELKINFDVSAACRMNIIPIQLFRPAA